MRKCLFQVFRKKITINSIYEPGKHYEGVFHLWGADYDEFEAGPGNKTMGIVESQSGDVLLIHPEDIIFAEPLTMGE
jgi:hypothetical protein